jgi:CheY-like chemotaxis protein
VRRHGGSGLGLAITRDIVQRMGGRIEVRSRPGEGSVFTATVVCGRVLPEPAAEPPAAPSPPPGPPPTLRILAAEDNPVNQLLIQAMLERLGHSVEIVGDGRQALEQAQHAAHDLVLMDMQMPDMDGPQATRAIRRLPPPAGQVPIVAMTANARAEDRQACLDAGMDDYVSKPIDLAALEAAIGGALQAGRRRRTGAPTAAEPARAGACEAARAALCETEPA